MKKNWLKGLLVNKIDQKKPQLEKLSNPVNWGKKKQVKFSKIFHQNYRDAWKRNILKKNKLTIT